MIYGVKEVSKKMEMGRNFLYISLIAILMVASFSIPAYSQMSIREIRDDLIKRSDLADTLAVFSGSGYGKAQYVAPEGIIVVVYPLFSDEGVINQKNLDLFFSKIGEVFASTKYPANIMFNIYVDVGKESSLIVRFPAKAMYDFFKEKITRSDFLKQCEIWINGEKAVVEGDIIKVTGEEFKMNFKF